MNARLVEALRRVGGLVLSAVAELGGEIVGHIAYSPVAIVGAQGNFSGLALAPMAVHPAKQRKGIGSALIRWSLDECRREGYALVIVLGHPAYYSRFGFVPAAPLDIRCPFEAPSEAFMMLELCPGVFRGRSGITRYRPEFAEL